MRLLTHGLKQRGHDVTVAGRPDAAPRAEIEALGVPYLPLALTGRLPDPGSDVPAYRALSSLLASGRFGVVHTHGQKAGALGRVAAAHHGVPSVYTPHSFVYRTQAMRPRRSGAVRFKIGREIERWLGRRTARIVAVAEAERATAIADRIAPPERIVVAHPGVAPHGTVAPDPELLAFRGEGPMLGFVAGLRDQKGLPVLLAALERLAAAGTPVRFAIVGNGPLWDEVAERVHSPALAATTMLAPFAGDPYSYLGAIDAFVLPSLWEGLPMAVLEAMTAGLPVLASAVNGTPEAVDDGVTGFLVPPGDAGALAERLKTLAGDAALRAKMGKAGKGVAEARFGVDLMVEHLIEVYRAAADLPRT